MASLTTSEDLEIEISEEEDYFLKNVKASREAPHCEIFGTETIKGHTVGALQPQLSQPYTYLCLYKDVFHKVENRWFRVVYYEKIQPISRFVP